MNQSDIDNTSPYIVRVNQSEYLDFVPLELRQYWSAQGIYQDKNLFAAFMSHVHATPHKAAIVEQYITVDFQTLARRASQLAVTLSQLGVGAGDIVAVNLANCWQACAVDLAIAALGAVSLPYPIGRKRHDSLTILTKSNACLLICQRTVGELDYAEMIDSSQGELPNLKAVIVMGEPYKHWLDLDELLCNKDGYVNKFDGEVDANAPVRIVVSSGTEAQPKLIAYSHNGLLYGQARYLDSLHCHPSSIQALFAIPLASPFGSLGTSCLLARYGGTLVLTHRFQPEKIIHLLTRTSVSHLFVSAPMVDALLAHSENNQCNGYYAGLILVIGGSALSAATVKRIQQQWGCQVIQSFGSADGLACHTEYQDTLHQLTESVGCPDKNIADIKIMRNEQQQAAIDQVGEIWALGPMTPMCYINSDELNQRYRRAGGWVRTTDLGKIDHSGRLHIIGRNADVIQKQGNKIYLPQLEAVLHEHPAISDVTLLETEPESLCACVVLRHQQMSLSLEQIHTFLLDHIGLERYKLPTMISVHRAFPLAPSGKVDKQQLKQWIIKKLL